MTTQEEAEICRRIGINEGCRLTRYRDSLGIWTIGIGFNLERADAISACRQAGFSYAAVMDDAPITQAQAQNLFHISFTPVLAEAVMSVTNFPHLSQARRFVICDLVFNLGAAGWNEFVNTRKYISDYDFESAASGLEASAWYNQVGERAVRNVTMMRTGEWVPQ